jgi:hypothetical protein
MNCLPSSNPNLLSPLPVQAKDSPRKLNKNKKSNSKLDQMTFEDLMAVEISEAPKCLYKISLKKMSGVPEAVTTCSTSHGGSTAKPKEEQKRKKSP